MEILQDTIIKLIIRQGPDIDRQAVVLTSGEQGYSTTTQRVYVGDGVVYGGHLVGNLYKGDIASGNFNVTNPVSGDLVFDIDTRKLYRNVISGNTTLAGWSQIGGVYVSGDNKINISSSNVITLCALSGDALNPNMVQYPLVLSAGKIALPPLSAGTVSEDLLRYPIVLSGGKISLPPLSSGTLSEEIVQYPIVLNNGKIYLPPLVAGTVDPDLVEAPIYINLAGRIALSANIPYERVSTNTITVSSGLKSYANGMDVTGIAVNPLSTSTVITSNQLLTRYKGSLSSTTYTRGISGTSLGVGSYRFNYGPLPTSQIYPMITVVGPYNLIANVTTVDLSSLFVTITDSVTPLTPVDAEIFIQISY